MIFPEPANSWFRQGTIESLAGVDCFVIERDHGVIAESDTAAKLGSRPAAATFARDGDGTRRQSPGDAVTVWLHGFPSSSLDWRGVIEQLRVPGHSLMLDFPGFGFSAKPAGYSYSLIDQADRVELMLRSRGIDRVRLVCHDMGTSVACELLARREMGLLGFSIDSVVFMNGSIYIEQARLTPSQKLLRSRLAGLYLRLASERMFRWQIRKITASPISKQELAAMWALMQHNEGLARMQAIVGYIDERYRFYRRWTGPLERLEIPALVLWGRRDPVAVAGIGQRLIDSIPGAACCWFDSVGHFPMLEDPTRTARALEDWHHPPG